MTQPEIISSYPGTGMREDISDLIFNIAPTETPFLSAIGTTSAGQRTHQWQTDVLDTPDGTNAHIEGDADVLEVLADTTLVNNETQISKKVFGVSGTFEVAEKYGRDSQIAYQAAKAARALKTDVDDGMTGVNVGSADTTSSDTVPRVSGSFETWLASNNSLGATTGAIAGFVPPGTTARVEGDVRDLTQKFLDDVIGSCWDNGGKPTMILAGRTQKEKMSYFDGVGFDLNSGTAGDQTSRTDRSTRTVWATVDVYVSNFGRLNVTPSRHITKDASVDSNIYVVDPEYAKTAYLRPWQQYDLAKTGDNIQRTMLVEWTLEVCNEKAHGIIADLDA